MSRFSGKCMFKNQRFAGVLAILFIMIFAEACRVKRCPLDNCHIRMRHRHPSMMGGGNSNDGGGSTLVYDPNAGPEANLGPVYRGTPWWERKKDPKIGEKYKPGYKYKHKDNRPAWSKRIVKYKKKRKKIEDDEKSGRKKNKKKKGKNRDQTESGDQEPEEMKLFGGDKSSEKKESKKERRAKAKKEKQNKKKDATPADAEESEDDGF